MFEAENQTLDQGFQGHSDPAHPVRQGGQRQGNPLTFGDLGDAVEGEVIGELVQDHPGQQRGGGQAAVDDRGGHRGSGDRFAGAAGVLRTDVADDPELGGDDVQLFADLFADQDPFLTALATGGGLRFVPHLDAGEMIGQGLATGPRARCTGVLRCRGGGLFESNLQGRFVGGQGLFEQVPLHTVQGFALLAIAQAAQMGQLQGQGLDLEVFLAQGFVVLAQGFVVLPEGFPGLFLGSTKEGLHGLVQAGWQGVLLSKTVEFGLEIQGWILPANSSESRMNTEFLPYSPPF